MSDFEEKLENDKIKGTSQFLRDCNLSLKQICEDVQHYREDNPVEDTQENLLLPSYLELVRRRDNLAATVATLAALIDKDV